MHAIVEDDDPYMQDRIEELMEQIQQRMAYLQQVLDEEELGIEEGDHEVSIDPKIVILQDALRKVRDELTEQYNEYDELLRLKSILESNHDKLSNSLDISRQQNDKLKMMLATANRRVMELETQEKTIEVEKRELLLERDRVEDDLKKLEEKAFDISQQNATLAQENSELSIQLAKIKEDFEAIETENFDYIQKIAQLEREIENKEREHDEYARRISLIEKNLEQDREEGDHFEKMALDLNQENMRMEETVRRLSDGIRFFLQYVRKDLPSSPSYKIIFTLMKFPKLRVRDFEQEIGITTKKVYEILVDLEKESIVKIDRFSGKSYPDYLCSMSISTE